MPKQLENIGGSLTVLSLSHTSGSCVPTDYAVGQSLKFSTEEGSLTECFTHLCATLPFLMSEMIKASPGFLLAVSKERCSQNSAQEHSSAEVI